jgi:anti-anti-sigma factor
MAGAVATTLRIKQDVRESAVVLGVAGDIDSATVDALIRQFDHALSLASDHSQRLLVVDLGKVTYFGSAGLNALLGCYQSGLADDVAVRVVATVAEVMRPLEVTKLDAVIRPYPSVAQALAGQPDEHE